MRRIPKRLVKVGQIVTCKRDTVVNFSAETSITFVPGVRLEVVSVDNPKVTYGYRHDGGTATFCGVIFQESNGTIRRIPLDYDNIKILKEPSHVETTNQADQKVLPRHRRRPGA